MATETEEPVATIEREDFRERPEDALEAAADRRQTAVVDEKGETRLLIGTNCRTLFPLPPEEDPPATTGPKEKRDRQSWFR